MSCAGNSVQFASAEFARLLEEMNVDALQGYLIARPMPMARVPDWLSEQSGRVRPGGVTIVRLEPGTAAR